MFEKKNVCNIIMNVKYYKIKKIETKLLYKNIRSEIKNVGVTWRE